MSTVPAAPRIAINNILFATDFSAISDSAMPFARAIARHYFARLHLLHVLVPANYLPIQPEPYTSAAPVLAREYAIVARAEAQRKMMCLYQGGQLSGIPWDVSIREGEIAAEIQAAIAEHQVDLVVLGTHGRSGFRKLLLGSVAEEIFRTTTCPVLTAGPKLFRGEEHGIHIRNVLCATDFSASAPRVVSFASHLAGDHKAVVTWLHVARGSADELPFRRRMAMENTRRRLNALIPGAGDADPNVRIEFGAASERILATAGELRPDVIIMGARGLGTIAAGSTHLPGGTTVKVICQALCPVLTIRD
jgi:nucleotide-binding universal stress UspA family protein